MDTQRWEKNSHTSRSNTFLAEKLKTKLGRVDNIQMKMRDEVENAWRMFAQDFHSRTADTGFDF